MQNLPTWPPGASDKRFIFSTFMRETPEIGTGNVKIDVHIRNTHRWLHWISKLDRKQNTHHGRPKNHLECYETLVLCRYPGCKWRKDPTSWCDDDFAFFLCPRGIVSTCWLSPRPTKPWSFSKERQPPSSSEETRSCRQWPKMVDDLEPSEDHEHSCYLAYVTPNSAEDENNQRKIVLPTGPRQSPRSYGL